MKYWVLKYFKEDKTNIKLTYRSISKFSIYYLFIFHYSVANKIKMGKKVEKSLKGEKNQSAVSQDEEDPNKTPGNSGNSQTM